jgi:hypothetical protein
MRVFEAIGSGALLVSDRAPGLEELFPDMYVPIGDSGLDIGRLNQLVSASEAESMAKEAHGEAMRFHTYDHRVDLLMRYVEGLTAGGGTQTPTPEDPIDVFLARHPYAQRILDAAGRVLERGREVWRPHDLTDDPRPASFDIVVLSGRSDLRLARAARRYVVGWDFDPARLGREYRGVSRVEDLIVVDLGAEGYDVTTVGGPAAFG